MGRSTAEQARRNRDRIVETASRLFRARGAEAVSVAEIMAAMGMTTGAFYKHFASKEALVQEACAASFDAAQKGWTRIADEAGGTAPATAIVAHYVKPMRPEQSCPMLAFAPDAAAEAPGTSLQATYAKGAEELYRAFAGSPEAEIDEDMAVLFAAMVGARLLADAAKGSDWSETLLAAVAKRARASERQDV